MPHKLVKLGFFLLYNHLAFTYEFVAWIVSLGQWSRWRQTVEQFLLSGYTLELAYGTGRLFTAMVQSGRKWVGIDQSPFMARMTARRLEQNGLSASAMQATAQYLPFPNGYFSNVVATFPTNYIFEPKTLAEIKRVLCCDAHAGARLIVVLQGQLIGPGPVKTFIEWLYRLTGQRAASKSAVLAQFTAAGFSATWQTASSDGATALLIVADIGP